MARTRERITNWRDAHKAGKVWLSTSFSGGKDTPLLGPTTIKTKGAVHPDTAFLIYMLLCGHDVESAQAQLAKAKADEVEDDKVEAQNKKRRRRAKKKARASG